MKSFFLRIKNLIEPNKVDAEIPIIKERFDTPVNIIHQATEISFEDDDISFNDHLLKLKMDLKGSSNDFAQPTEVPKEKSVKKILIAEDDVLIRKSISYFLTDKGFDICQVDNGNQAVEEIKKCNFDLIITDLNMPSIGGMELINIMRNNLQNSTPIIVLTSSNIEEIELKSFKMGASEFISKPFSPSVLMARIYKLIGTVILFYLNEIGNV